MRYDAGMELTRKAFFSTLFGCGTAAAIAKPPAETVTVSIPAKGVCQVVTLDPNKETILFIDPSQVDFESFAAQSPFMWAPLTIVPVRRLRGDSSLGCWGR